MSAPPSWEEKAQALGVDEMCMSALRSVPSERAHQILNDIQAKGSEIRNPSAFVSKAAREAWDDSETLRRALETDVWSGVLDDSAKAELRAAEASTALSVLADVRNLGENVRNPSSYVCSTLRKRVAEGRFVASAGFPATISPVAPQRASTISPVVAQFGSPWSRPISWPTPSASSMGFRSMSAPLPPRPQREATPTEKMEIDAVISELAPDLDERAVERIYQLLSPEEARKALESLAEAGPDVRNKSAFVNGIVNKRLQFLGNSTEVSPEDEVAESLSAEEFEKQLASFEDLDEQARQAMSEVKEKLGAAAGLLALKELQNKKDQGDLRNVSGFAMRMARTRLSGVQATPGAAAWAGSQAQTLETGAAGQYEQALVTWDQELDERAKKVLEELQQLSGSAVALNVLKELESKMEKEEVRNPSSFVFSMARQRIQQAAPQAAPAAFASPVPMLGAQAQMRSTTIMPQTAPRTITANRSTATLPWIQENLEAYGLKGKLDEIVLMKMMTAPQERITEILQDMAAKDDPVRNPSAFIQKSLTDFPDSRKRTLAAAVPMSGGWAQGGADKRARVDLGASDPFAQYQSLISRMDEAAVSKLRGHHDQSRVQEILSETAAKIHDIRNPSAFVSRALNDASRGNLSPMF